MALGAGKYDHETTLLREVTGAEGVMLIVLGGNAGNGFSVQASAAVQARLPELLRTIAGEIERDLPAVLREMATSTTRR